MKIRRLTAADAAAFRDIRLLMLQTDPAAFGSTYADWAAKPMAEIKAWIEMMHLFAAMEGDQCLATAAWHRFKGDTVSHRGHVIAVYTRPEARGQGLFRQIMAALEADARAEGVLQLDLDVSVSQPAAFAGYLALGYTELGRCPRALCHDGVYSDKIMMQKLFEPGAETLLPRA
ncbi:GNAT family N-acetyltransferase [Rhodophyticola sp. CCM32]|uniref:GNAT family N-acetyltransferase n=1 Tax=Rhodophyticola sp. CCM32 TaxID=2916397 RepID=UPI00107F4BC1|nr:GNAT family N-acetyltransferase [Rhodophyticola sp. CCM32]QBY00110.1 GNAT family N-acetyltransferase [Rhodophyticola sp. CCM32]